MDNTNHAPIAADIFSRNLAARPLSPSSIKILNHTRRVTGKGANVIHPPKRITHKISYMRIPAIQILSETLQKPIN
jgi:hypothetical protein